jgi:hypothetical protein
MLLSFFAFFNRFISTAHSFYAHSTSLTVNDVAIKGEILSARLAIRSLLKRSSAYLHVFSVAGNQRVCKIMTVRLLQLLRFWGYTLLGISPSKLFVILMSLLWSIEAVMRHP